MVSGNTNISENVTGSRFLSQTYVYQALCNDRMVIKVCTIQVSSKVKEVILCPILFLLSAARFLRKISKMKNQQPSRNSSQFTCFCVVQQNMNQNIQVR